MNDNQLDTDNLELASVMKRATAFVIDDIIVTLIVFVIFWESISNNMDNLESMLVGMNQFVFPILFLKFVYQAFFIWIYGATIGKIIVKIRVIDYNSFQRVNLLSSIFRSFARILSEMFFYIGFLFSLFNDGRQTFHDKIGRTLVVNV